MTKKCDATREKIKADIIKFGSRQAFFNHYFDYTNGKLYRKNCKISINNGKEAGNHYNKYVDNYYTFIKGMSFQTSTIIYEMHFGRIFPNLQLGHVNGDTSDNRLENLFVQNASLKQLTSKIYNTNTSGFKGVSWSPARQKWMANIMKNYKQIHLGGFVDILHAKAVRDEVFERIVEISKEEIKEIIKKYKRLELAA